MGLAHPSLAPYGVFESADGVAIVISIQNEREWYEFCAFVIGDPSLATRPGFDGAPARVENRQAVDGLVAEAFSALPLAELSRRLDAAGTAWARVNDLAGLTTHPVLRTVAVEVPGGGSISMVAPAPVYDGATPVLRPVPALGAHSEAIRAETKNDAG
jgi:itaconate CoA-transferase